MNTGKRGLMVGMVLTIITFSGLQAQDTPRAVNDNGSTQENVPVTINVVANDTDADGDINPSTVDLDVDTPGIQATATTPKGSYSVDNDGVVTFTPANDISGPATIKYTVSDSTDRVSNKANIDIDVQAVNAAPVAQDDTGATTNDKDVQINVLANDSDSDGTLDTSKVDLNPAMAGIQKSINKPEGAWTVSKGVVKYKPKDTFVGSALLDYVVYDNENAASNTATVTISVTTANIAPVAVNDTGGTTVNKATTVNVVANDTDSDGSIDATKVDLNTATAGIQSTANTSQGSWSVNPQGVVTYTPIALFAGSATLNYTVMDNDGAVSNAASITITVQLLNIAPVAVNDNVTTSKNKAVTIKVTQNDTDIDGTIDVTKVDLNPTLAGVQNTAQTAQGDYAADAQGVVTFTPANNFTGVAAQTYTVADNAGAISNTASINITVQNVNSPPVAMDDTGATSQNTSVTVNVVANDTDSDGVINAAKVDLNTTTGGIQNTATVPQGEFSVNNIGIVTYKPKKDFTGSVALNYTVSDNENAISNVATITIAVQPKDAPIAKEDVDTTSMNHAIEINVVANDTDSDGEIDASTVDLNQQTAGVQNEITGPEGGFTVNKDGILTYTPAKDFFGSVSVQYTVMDNDGVLSNVALISITVQEVPNEAPVIVAFEDETDTLRYTPGNPIEITDEFEVEDADDDSLAVAEVGFLQQAFTAASDKLLFENTDAIKGSFDEVSGLLTLSGPAKISDYNEAIRSVKYEHTGTEELRTTIKGLYVRLSDGKDFSEIKQRIIKINSGVTDLDIPTAFTPNSDGANDTWRILAPSDISGSDFADAEIRVYDKKGTVVFGANGLANTWDGTYQGKHLPVDTYYYTIDLKTKQKRYKGIVAILR